jgi:hypothetical protein
MSLADLGYRLRDKIISLFNDDRKFVKLISRLGFLGLVAAIILIVAPTSADQNTPQAETVPAGIVETTTAIVETITQTVDVIPVDTQSINMAETLTSLSVQETATPIATQPKFSIKIPSSLTVDPRANSKFVPSITISGSEYVLVCISGNGLNIDVSDKRVNSDNAGDGVVVVACDGRGGCGDSEAAGGVVSAGGGASGAGGWGGGGAGVAGICGGGGEAGRGGWEWGAVAFCDAVAVACGGGGVCSEGDGWGDGGAGGAVGACGDGVCGLLAQGLGGWLCAVVADGYTAQGYLAVVPTMLQETFAKLCSFFAASMAK